MNAPGSAPRPPPAAPERPKADGWEHGKNGCVVRDKVSPDQWWASMPHMGLVVELLLLDGHSDVARREYSTAPNCGWYWATTCHFLVPDHPLIVAWRP